MLQGLKKQGNYGGPAEGGVGWFLDRCSTIGRI